MMAEVLGVVLVVVLSILIDPFLWLLVVADQLEKEDRKNNDLHIWERTGL